MKMKTAYASPWASRVRSPDVISSDDVEVYRPGKRVSPPRFPETEAPPGRPAALLYAIVRSPWACAAVGSPKCVVPFTVGDPVTVVPGLTPRFPLTVVAPLLVTVVAARTANLAVDPRGTIAWTAAASWRANSTTNPRPRPISIRFVPSIPTRVALSPMQIADFVDIRCSLFV